MDFSVVYLGRRLLYRIGDFFHHWYMDGSRAFGRRFMATITGMDQSIALAITLRHFFEPLYKDYTIVGRILGVVFRTFRVVIGSVIYLFVMAVFVIVYIVWLSIPAIIIFNVIRYL